MDNVYICTPKEKEDIMNTEVLKEKREYALDYSKNIQKMKFNIIIKI